MEVDQITIEAFSSLLKGRTDCWGSVEGKSNKETVTEEHYRAHLEGKRSLGIYPLLDNGTCYFAAIDLDEKDFNKTVAIRNRLVEQFIPAYISESKTKGYHIYVFALEAFVARDIRRVLQHTLDSLNIKAEIFPKQDMLDETTPIGNYINLPCFGATRQFWTTDLKIVPLSSAVAQFKFTPEESILRIIKELPVEKPVKPKKTSLKKMIRRHPPCIEKIFGGVGKGARDEAAFALARHYLDWQMPPSDILNMLKVWDEKNQPPFNDSKLLETKIESAEKGYAFGCSSIVDNPMLAEFCVGEDECSWLRETKTEFKAYFEERPDIRPALDFVDNTVYITIPMDIDVPITKKTKGSEEVIGVKKARRLVTITSDKEIFPTGEDTFMDRGLTLIGSLQVPTRRWSLESVREFISGNNTNLEIKDTFQVIKQKYRYYMDFEQDITFSLAALWVIGTYFFPLFTAYPYVYFGGVREAGKSVDGNTPMLTNRGIMSVSEIIDKTLESSSIRDGEYEISYDNPYDISIPIFNSATFKVEWQKPKAFIRHPAPRQLIKFTTYSGKEITVTEDHSLLSYRNDKIIEIRGSELKIKDVLLSVKNIPHIEEKTSINISDYITQSTATNSKLIPELIKLDKDLGYFLGWFLAEGSASEKTGYIQFSNHNTEVLELLAEISHKIFKLEGSIGTNVFYLVNKNLSRWLKKICYIPNNQVQRQYHKDGAQWKRLPSFAFSAPRDFISSLLGGYFSGDGYIAKEITVASKSKGLIFGVSSLLLTLGIGASTRIHRNKKYGNSYELKVLTNDNHKFTELIPVIGKEFKLRDICWGRTDSLKQFGSLFKSLQRGLSAEGIGIGNKIHSHSVRRVMSRGVASQIVSTAERALIKREEQIIGAKDALDKIKILLGADVFFDEVKSICEVQPSNNYVYDFSTDNETFIAGNIVAHNTKMLTLTQQMAFNSISSGNISTASIFRIVEGSRATLLIDEAEKLSFTDRGQEFRNILNASYKPGNPVYRTEKNSREQFIVTAFDAYSPKMLANISGLEDVLESRVIPWVLLRTLDTQIANREIDTGDSSWQEIRDRLYMLALTKWKEVKEIYDNTKPVEKVKARNWEIWKPIIALAELCGIKDEMITCAQVKSEEKIYESSVEADDSLLIRALLDIVKSDDYYTRKAIQSSLVENYYDGISPKWLSGEWLGRHLKRQGLAINKRRNSNGVSYHLTPEMIKVAATRMGVLNTYIDMEI